MKRRWIISGIIILGAIGLLVHQLTRIATPEEVLGPAPPPPAETHIAALDKLVSVDFRKTPLKDALSVLSDRIGTPLQLEFSPDADNAASESVTLRMHDVSAAETIKWMAAQTTLVDLTLRPEATSDGIILLLQRPGQRPDVIIANEYDLNRLIDIVASRSAESTFRRWWREAKEWIRPNEVLFSDTEWSLSREEIEREISQLVMDSIEPDDWKQTGGVLYGLEVNNGMMQVNATAEIHERIYRMLYDLYMALEHGVDTIVTDKEADERYEKLLARMQRPVTLEGGEIPIGDAFERVAEQMGVNIILNTFALDLDTPYALKIDAVPGEAALNEIILQYRPASIDRSVLRVEHIEPDTIVIRRADAWPICPLVRMYVIGDLADAIGRSNPDAFGGEPRLEAIQYTMQALREACEPDDWRMNGGLRSSMTAIDDVLIISAPMEVHRQVRMLLAKWRREGGVPAPLRGGR
ncbi:MAG: hypothetical protein GC162_05435 [Planctomycetes bacterium]|nr:hypothetical protein [Planctomycetota bacterium]